MRISRRELEARNRRQAARIDRFIEERDEAQQGERACASQLERVARELSIGKDVIATHVIATGHPSTVLHSPEACMESLVEALEANGFHLRLEMARIEGRDL
ncbi:hypothetical protein ACFXKY_07730 [Streptomyces canus]|uniref:hypothetical protein n=1 Tax=Streptomyces canus TaxID=58343 RepID=UPI0036CD907F